jgi:hypothetical protein
MRCVRFDVHAVDDLLEPVDNQRLADAMAQVRIMSQVRSTSRYAVRFATRRVGEVGVYVALYDSQASI